MSGIHLLIRSRSHYLHLRTTVTTTPGNPYRLAIAGTSLSMASSSVRKSNA